MAMDPYKKRMLQGAAQGATTGATAGYMLGGPIPGTVGLIGGGVAGALMARPGEDEQRFRARMRQLELGVLGPEEAAIRGRFMDPVRGAAQQQETARRALEQGTVTSGASARRAQAAQTAARRDIGEAAAEAEMAIMDLGERRRMMADRMRDQLRREEDQRTRQFRAQMADDLIGLGTTVGGEIAGQRLHRQAEKARLADQVEAGSDVVETGRPRQNQTDLDFVADERAMSELSDIDFGMLPEAGEVARGTGAAAQADALEAAYRDSPFLFGEATPAAPEPTAPTRRAAAAPPAALDYSADDAAMAFDALGIDLSAAPETAPPAAPETAPPAAPMAVDYGAAAADASARLAAAQATQEAADIAEARQLALDPEYRDLYGALPGLSVRDRNLAFKAFRKLTDEQKQQVLTGSEGYESILQMAGEL